MDNHEREERLRTIAEEWEREGWRRARDEGWQLVTRDGRFRIERAADRTIFDCDADAIGFVQRQAASGARLHADALLLHGNVAHDRDELAPYTESLLVAMDSEVAYPQETKQEVAGPDQAAGQVEPLVNVTIDIIPSQLMRRSQAAPSTPGNDLVAVLGALGVCFLAFVGATASGSVAPLALIPLTMTAAVIRLVFVARCEHGVAGARRNWRACRWCAAEQEAERQRQKAERQRREAQRQWEEAERERKRLARAEAAARAERERREAEEASKREHARIEREQREAKRAEAARIAAENAQKEAERQAAHARYLQQIRTGEYLKQMDPEEFEHLLCELFRRMGYDAETTPYSGDDGADGILEKNGERAVVQAKRLDGGYVGPSVLRDLRGTMAGFAASHGILVTTGKVTKGAKRWAAKLPELRIIELDELVDLIREHFPEVENAPEDFTALKGNRSTSETSLRKMRCRQNRLF